MPPALDITVLSDRTQTIRASVADVEFELMLAVILVVLVIFVFLRNAPATIIPSLSVPLSLVGTFGAMYLLNYSLDNLSLMALTISTGFVVDDAIVMIENIARYIEAGDAAAGRRAQGLAADRLHHHLTHRIADRRADSAAVHGRDRRPAVPRVRHHARRDHRDLRRGIAHPRAHAVRAACCITGRRRRAARGTCAPSAAFSGSSTGTSAASNWVLDRQGLTLARRRHHPGDDAAPVRVHPERVLSGAGHGRDPGHLRGGRRPFPMRPWRSGSRRSPPPSSRTRTSNP